MFGNQRMLEQPSELNRKKLKALVLCSSGLDSTYNLLKAKKEFADIMVAFFDYNQKSSPQEYLHVKKLCLALGVHFMKIDMPWYRMLSSSLIDRSKNIATFASLKNLPATEKPSEWVPNRNGVFVNVGAAIAESNGFDFVVIGINKEEAERYPDNTQEFMDKANELFKISTLSSPKLISYSANMLKVQIFGELTGLMKEFNLGKEYIWSCYDSYEKMCGVCESCLRLKRAIKENEKESEWQDLFLK